MIGRVIADHVDDRRARPARIVQVRGAVGIAWSQMKQGAGGHPGHARISIGSPRHHALEQAQHRPHPRLLVQRSDELHLAGAGVGETDGHVVRDQGRQKSARSIHGGISY